MSRLRERFKVPIVITGFEPIDMLEGILRSVAATRSRAGRVENQYSRAVRREGNPAAKKLIDEVFEVCDRKWRGVGAIPQSGYRLRPKYRDHDAERIFEVDEHRIPRNRRCASAARSCRAEEAARLPAPSASNARRKRRSGPPWSRRKAPVPPITPMAGIWPATVHRQ